MKYITKFENFQGYFEVVSCIQNLLDIGFDSWDSEGIVMLEGSTTVDEDFIKESELTIKKLFSCGYDIRVIKWNGESLKFGKEPIDTIYIHYPGLDGKKSDKGESYSTLLDFFKNSIHEGAVKIKSIYLRIVPV